MTMKIVILNWMNLYLKLLFDLLEKDWTNPFVQDPSDIVSVSTGVAAAPKVSHNLLHVLLKGEEVYQHFLEMCLQMF